VHKIPIIRPLSAAASVLLAAGLAAGCSSSGSSNGSAVVIKAVLPPNTGPITSADNAGLKKLTTQYEAAHKKVTVQWLPNNTASITAANAAVESQASGGSAPDLVWEQYGPVTSGGMPKGLLQNIKPYLDKPNPTCPATPAGCRCSPSPRSRT
jgi:ABC-type glycerol-3-phosphate transport system substrate-binding protein